VWRLVEMSQTFVLVDLFPFHFFFCRGFVICFSFFLVLVISAL